MKIDKAELKKAEWRTSTLSSAQGNCVEVAMVGESIAVRDSKDRQGPALVFTEAEWKAFVGGVKLKEFDLR